MLNTGAELNVKSSETQKWLLKMFSFLIMYALNVLCSEAHDMGIIYLSKYERKGWVKLYLHKQTNSEKM